MPLTDASDWPRRIFRQYRLNTSLALSALNALRAGDSAAALHYLGAVEEVERLALKEHVREEEKFKAWILARLRAVQRR